MPNPMWELSILIHLKACLVANYNKSGITNKLYDCYKQIKGHKHIKIKSRNKLNRNNLLYLVLFL